MLAIITRVITIDPSTTTDGLNTEVAKTDASAATETYALRGMGEVTFDRYGFRQDVAARIEEPLTEYGRAVVPLAGGYDPEEPEPGYTVDASVADLWLNNIEGNLAGTGGNPLHFLRAFFEEDGNAILATVKGELMEGVPQASHVPLDYLDTELGWSGVVYHAPADRPMEAHRADHDVPADTQETAYSQTRVMETDEDGRELFDDNVSAAVDSPDWQRD